MNYVPRFNFTILSKGEEGRHIGFKLRIRKIKSFILKVNILKIGKTKWLHFD